MEGCLSAGSFHPESDVICLRTATLALIALVLIPLFSTEADEGMALERLMKIVSVLQQLGDEMLGDPVTGTLAVSDTIAFQLTFSSEYMYNINIWSDSYFNILEFWLTDFRGEVISTACGDNASLAAYPDTTGEWTLQILLHEGASSDSASYAAAVFRSRRHNAE